MTRKKRTLSGIKPSGFPHLGNYLGMMLPALAMQKTHQTYYFIADYHALTTVEEPSRLQEWTYDLVAAFYAFGMDFKEHVFFRQSDVPEVTELAWLLSCITPQGLLERAHAYKDARGKNNEINHGVFAYPVLMAADILLYDADEVPVGKDQKQHLEMTRDLALRFNHRYGEVFRIPEPVIAKDVGAIPGIDGRKMSKSYNNQLPLFSTEKALRKAVMRVVTDSKSVGDVKDPNQCNVFALFTHFSTLAEQTQWAMRYRQGGMGYGEMKQALFENMNRTLSPFRESFFEIRNDDTKMETLLVQGAQKARQTAQQVVQRARQSVGLPKAPALHGR